MNSSSIPPEAPAMLPPGNRPPAPGDRLLSWFVLEMQQPANPHGTEITALLQRLSSGDQDAEESLLQCVYFELHRIAGRLMTRERPGHTLQPTALVNEAYLRLCRETAVSWDSRVHFFAIAARVMRRILTDHARRRTASKRGGADQIRVEFIDSTGAADKGDHNLGQVLAIDQLLVRLAQLRPREAQIVEMRYFAGMTDDEIAAVLGTSRRTVLRDWLKARAWLYERLTSPSA